MKIMLHVPSCLAIAGYLLFAGCIKDPTSPNNPKPEWLLEKITTTDGYQDDNGALPFYSSVVNSSSFLPRMSQNNWTRTSNGQWSGPRIITLNAQGLVERTALPHGITVPERFYYKTYYQYRRAD